MEESNITELVAEKLRAVEQGDHFALLGLETSASKAEVQKAYFSLAKQVHPDRMARVELGDMSDGASRLFQRVSEAYNVLIDANAREKYQVEFEAKGAAGEAMRSTQELIDQDPDDPGVTEREAAKIFYHRGTMLMKKGGFDDAERLLRRAYEADSENPRYTLRLGWAVYQNGDRARDERLKEAQKHLEKALELDGENPEAHYYMARIFKDVGDTKACKKHLEKAVSLRDNYIEAKRELRLLEMRARSGGGGSKGRKKGAGKKDAKKSESEGGRWPFGLDKLFRK
jgi:DnaJ family protein C protein 7